MRNPFPPTASKPGNGRVHLALLPPSTPVLKTLTYQYPLKLISPAPETITPKVDEDSSHLVHTLYVLTYGGGIVAGDTLDMHIEVDSATRLVMLTQGSTKIFKTPDAARLSRQDLDMRLGPGAAIVYLPDPVQPFAKSSFVQTQRYHILCGRPKPKKPDRTIWGEEQAERLRDGLLSSVHLPKEDNMDTMDDCLRQLEAYHDVGPDALHSSQIHKILIAISKLENIPREEGFKIRKRCDDLLDSWSEAISSIGKEKEEDKNESENEKLEGASLCVLDWVCQGRKALGEEWDFWKYGSKNEVWLVDLSKDQEEKRLLLRDNVLLDSGIDGVETPVAKRMDGIGAFGSLILYGPKFERLGKFFMDEFKETPRIGGRKWDTGSDDGNVEEVDAAEVKRKSRQKQETTDGLLWSAATVRGCVVVKFGAREVEGGKRWLRCMLETEGSVPDQFGERSLLCLR